MNKRVLYTLAVIAILATGLINATVFAYRWIAGTITVAPATEARGAACAGFYSSAAQSGITLPSAGTNYDAYTYGTNKISVTPGQVVCQWDNYKLYESIEVSIPVTVGSWYIQDFYGFGYNGTPNDPKYPKVYVYFRVDSPVSPSGVLSEARLIIYRAGTKVAELNLLASGDPVGPVELSPGQALRLDLKLDTYDIASEVSVSFKVGVYVSQEAEAPLSPTP